MTYSTLITGGYLANSLAIATDAFHLLSDAAGFAISLFAIYAASLPPTRRLNFGWHRAEVIGALASILLIWVLTGILCYMAYVRIVEDTFEVDAEIMLITSSIGVGVNLIMLCTLHNPFSAHGHSHGGGASHGHSHGDGENINVRAAIVHVVGDIVQVCRVQRQGCQKFFHISSHLSIHSQ